MKWHERILESWAMRWMVTFMITLFLSGVLVKIWSLKINLAMALIGVIIASGQHEFIIDSRAGVSTKHDFAGWLVLTFGISAVISSIMNTLFMLNKL